MNYSKLRATRKSKLKQSQFEFERKILMKSYDENSGGRITQVDRIGHVWLQSQRRRAGIAKSMME